MPMVADASARPPLVLLGVGGDQDSMNVRGRLIQVEGNMDSVGPKLLPQPSHAFFHPGLRSIAVVGACLALLGGPKIAR